MYSGYQRIDTHLCSTSEVLQKREMKKRRALLRLRIIVAKERATDALDQIICALLILVTCNNEQQIGGK